MNSHCVENFSNVNQNYILWIIKYVNFIKTILILASCWSNLNTSLPRSKTAYIQSFLKKRDCFPFFAQVSQPPYALQLFTIQMLSRPYHHPSIQYLLNAYYVPDSSLEIQKFFFVCLFFKTKVSVFPHITFQSPSILHRLSES